jgi:hypothetical protein
VHDVVALEAHRPLEREEEQHNEERLRRRLDSHPPELEEPWREACEDDDDHGHEPTPREAKGEHAQQEDRRENQDGGEPARNLLIRTGELEDPCEQVRVDGALVVVERPEEQREANPVLVA